MDFGIRQTWFLLSAAGRDFFTNLLLFLLYTQVKKLEKNFCLVVIIQMSKVSRV